MAESAALHQRLSQRYSAAAAQYAVSMAYRIRFQMRMNAREAMHVIELRSALDRLTDRQRIVVVLRYFVDIPDEEIARILDVKPSTVRSLAHRALSALRKELR